VIYAAYLHARATAGWRGRPAAYIAIIGLLAFLFSYFGVNLFFVGLHSYGGV
jgi:ABC-type transport system involved in cytochrome c biogenesis permease subunit